MIRSLKSNQLLLWTGQQMYPDTPLYNMVFTFAMETDIDELLFVKAFEIFAEKCDAFQATIQIVNGEPVIKYDDQMLAELTIIDIAETADGSYTDWLEKAKRKITPLHVRLYDSALVKAEDGHYRWYLNMHHLITDGWSYTLIHQYVTTIYSHLLHGESTAELEIPSTSNYAAPPVKHEEHWRSKLETLPVPEYYYKNSNPAAKTEAIRQSYQLADDKMAQLKSLLTKSHYRSWTIDQSMYTFLLTVLTVVMHRLSGGSDITIGSPTHGRDTSEDKKSVDVYMNLLPLAIHIDNEETYETLYKKCQVEVNSFLRYAPGAQSFPALAKSYHTILNYINTTIDTSASPKMQATWEHSGHSDPGHHLTVQAYDFNGTGNTTISFDMNVAVFDKRHQSLLIRQFFDVMDTFLEHPSLSINLASQFDQREIEKSNDTYKDYGTKTIIDHFYEQVDLQQDNAALYFAGQSMSYADLEEKTNQLANHLISEGIKPEDRVAICIERSFEMLIGIYGILKSGAAYVPIDPTFPSARKQYVLKHSDAKILILASKENAWDNGGIPAIYLEDFANRYKQKATSRPSHRPTGSDLMYIIYTSGSTGSPKGVMNQHDGVVNRLNWAQDEYQLVTGTDVALLKTNFCFDVSVWEIFWPLMVGVPLCIAKPEGEKEGDYLTQLIQDRQVSIIHFVPSMLEIFLLTPGLTTLPSLTKILCSGERLPLTLAHDCLTKLPNTDLHNLYGPTEAAIDVTATQIFPTSDLITIGSPVTNTEIQIQSYAGEQLGIGVPGEITIYGVQVARGYHNDPERNRQQFGKHGDSDQPSRYYRTGDIGYWLEDGTIAYMGRIDNQIKLRGYRIELGEIESALMDTDGVQNAIVILHEINAAQKLAAFLICDDDTDTSLVRSRIQSVLPSYMIPDIIQILNEMPLTHTGKIDRQTLRGLVSFASSDVAVRPEDEFEEIIHDIWCELFGMDAISTRDTFFALGGDSLMAIRSMIRINEAFQLELPMSTIFRSPTIVEIAALSKETIIRLMADMD